MAKKVLSFRFAIKYQNKEQKTQSHEIPSNS